MKTWLLGTAFLSLAACDSGDVMVSDGGLDVTTQDSPIDAAPKVDSGADATTLDAPVSEDAMDEPDATDDAPVDADTADSPSDAESDASSSDAGTCTSNTDCPLVGYYCEKGNGNCNGTGVCTFAPQFCSNIVSPVCGCDGTTYNNACKAHRGLTSVDHTGNCP